MTVSSNSSNLVYKVDVNGYVLEEISLNLKTVIHLKRKVLYKSGDGTKKNPYILK